MIGITKEYASAELLGSLNFFGQYGQIMNISINKTAYQNYKYYCAYIKYVDELSACLAIISIQSKHIKGFELLRASYATTNYCKYYVKKIACRTKKCSYAHVKAQKSDCVFDIQKQHGIEVFDAMLHKALEYASENLKKFSSLVQFLNMKNGEFYTVLPTAEKALTFMVTVKYSGHETLNKDKNCYTGEKLKASNFSEAKETSTDTRMKTQSLNSKTLKMMLSKNTMDTDSNFDPDFTMTQALEDELVQMRLTYKMKKDQLDQQMFCRPQSNLSEPTNFDLGNNMQNFAFKNQYNQPEFKNYQNDADYNTEVEQEQNLQYQKFLQMRQIYMMQQNRQLESKMAYNNGMHQDMMTNQMNSSGHPNQNFDMNYGYNQQMNQYNNSNKMNIPKQTNDELDFNQMHGYINDQQMAYNQGNDPQTPYNTDFGMANNCSNQNMYYNNMQNCYSESNGYYSNQNSQETGNFMYNYENQYSNYGNQMHMAGNAHPQYAQNTNVNNIQQNDANFQRKQKNGKSKKKSTMISPLRKYNKCSAGYQLFSNDDNSNSRGENTISDNKVEKNLQNSYDSSDFENV